MDNTVVSFRNYGFQYNAQAKPTLYNINLDIHRGEKILIAGPSGCGKSTLAHCINGLIPYSYKGEVSGELFINGKNTSKLSLFDISKDVGTVLQDSDGQFIGLTVAEDIAFALENDCVSDPELHEHVYKVAQKVNILSHLNHAPNEISGGQKQRVSLAGVLVDDVDILLFDEPLANLDPATGKQAIELIDEIQRETGATVIIIEHRLEDVLHRHVDRIVLMGAGKIIKDCSPAELLSSNLLIESGIREPLYITALKYSGVIISPDMHPESIDIIELSPNTINLVRKWYSNISVRDEKDYRETILKADDIVFSYPNGKLANNHISTTIRKGEMLAIIGTNGAGKSTFSKLICGFETQQEGSFKFNGNDLSELSIKERADHIGYVMQNPNQMISKVKIFDEVALGLITRGVDEDTINERVKDTLSICGLSQFRKWPISALSFGQKKRVTIASILALNPEIIILDEPTAGQDYRHYTEIMEFLSELNSNGVTVIMVTHDMHLMLEYADRAIVFSDGKIIADDRCSVILTDSEVILKASLRETSLYNLAIRCGINDASGFVQRFIDYEREVIRE